MLCIYSNPKIKKKGEKIKKLFVGLSLCVLATLLISMTGVKAQGLLELPSIENMDVDIALELLPDARSHVTIDIVAQFEMEELLITDGNLSLRVSSPNSEQLKFDVTGSVTLTEAGLGELPEEARTMLTMMNADMINDLIARSGIEGQSLSEFLPGFLTMVPGAEEIEMPPEMEDIVIKDLRCTKLSWGEPTIEAGLTTTLSGSVFEKKVDLSLDIDITVEGNTATVELTFDGYFDLPRVGDNVRWGLEIPEIGTIPGLENFALENLGEFLEQYDIDFTLRVPEDASVSGLPPGYSQAGGTYTWSGVDAAGALSTVLTGEVQPDITYEYAPPSEFPWLVVGVLVVTIVAIAAAVVVLRRR
ncbi:MAG: hypothetical protein ACE5OT_00420 [Candidatus Hadarchaeaceae archaeon]